MKEIMKEFKKDIVKDWKLYVTVFSLVFIMLSVLFYTEYIIQERRIETGKLIAQVVDSLDKELSNKLKAELDRIDAKYSDTLTYKSKYVNSVDDSISALVREVESSEHSVISKFEKESHESMEKCNKQYRYVSDSLYKQMREADTIPGVASVVLNNDVRGRLLTIEHDRRMEMLRLEYERRVSIQKLYYKYKLEAQELYDQRELLVQKYIEKVKGNQ